MYSCECIITILCLVRFTASILYKKEAIMQNKQMVLLVVPAKVPSCKPAFLLPTLTAVDRTSSGKIPPAVCPTPPVVQVVEQVFLPSASISLWSGPSKQSEIMQYGQRSSGGGKFTRI